MRRFGSRVTIIDRNARLAHREDQDVTDMLHEMFREEGIEVVTSAHITRVEGKSGAQVKLYAVRDGSEIILEARIFWSLVAALPTPRVLAWSWPELKQLTVVT